MSMFSKANNCCSRMRFQEYLKYRTIHDLEASPPLAWERRQLWSSLWEEVGSTPRSPDLLPPRRGGASPDATPGACMLGTRLCSVSSGNPVSGSRGQVQDRYTKAAGLQRPGTFPRTHTQVMITYRCCCGGYIRERNY